MSDSATWLPLGSNQIRQTVVYKAGESRWDEAFEFSGSVVARSPFGGPVALTRDAGKLVDLRGSVDDDVSIYSAAGALLAKVPRDADAGALVHLAWSGRELLYVVYETGVVDVCVVVAT